MSDVDTGRTAPQSKMRWLVGMGGCCVVTLLASALGLGGLAWLGRGQAGAAAVSPAPASQASAFPSATAPERLTLTFNGTEYIHRWSRNGINEFTPLGQEDLDAWTDMIVISVVESVSDADQLQELGEGVRASNVSKGGQLLSDESLPGTGTNAPERSFVNVFNVGKAREAGFSRVMLWQQRGVVVAYAKRIYGGPEAFELIKAWMKEHSDAVDARFRAWRGIPDLAALRALPQADR